MFRNCSLYYFSPWNPLSSAFLFLCSPFPYQLSSVPNTFFHFIFNYFFHLLLSTVTKCSCRSSALEMLPSLFWGVRWHAFLLLPVALLSRFYLKRIIFSILGPLSSFRQFLSHWLVVLPNFPSWLSPLPAFYLKIPAGANLLRGLCCFQDFYYGGESY